VGNGSGPRYVSPLVEDELEGLEELALDYHGSPLWSGNVQVAAASLLRSRP
jgi:hypothetical protein